MKELTLQELKEVEFEINNNQNTLLEITKSIEKIDGDIRLFKERQKYNEDSLESSTNKIIKLRENTLKLEIQINEYNNNIEKLKEVLKGLYSQIIKEIMQLDQVDKASLIALLQELSKAKKRIKSRFAYAAETVSEIGETIGYYMTVCDDLDLAEQYIPICESITAEDLQNERGGVLQP